MSLSMREIEIAEAVGKGFSNNEIADRLFITEKTVKFHLTNIYQKLGLRTRAQLIVKLLNERVNGEDINAFKELMNNEMGDK